MKAKGFTLIELVIAIVIIGTLAAIVIPVFQKDTPLNESDHSSRKQETSQFEESK